MLPRTGAAWNVEDANVRTPDRVVVHVIAGDLPAVCRDALETLCENGASALSARCLHIGPGRIWTPRGRKAVRVHAPLAWPRLGARALRAALRRQDPPHLGQTVILHAWTPMAAAWSTELTAPAVRVLVEVDSAVGAARYVCWPRSGRLADMPTYVCPTSATQQQLRQLGVPLACTVLIRPGVGLRISAHCDRERRPAVRAHLGLGEPDVVVLALPPVARQVGTLYAAWGAMLLEKIRPDVRLVIPGDGPEQQRVRRLVEACRHEEVVRFAGESVPLPDLLAAADIAVYLPADDAATTGVVWAMAVGCPLIVSALPSILETVDGDAGARLCQPHSPADAARQMLRALEDPRATQARADHARRRAADMFSLERMLTQYADCYGELASIPRH